MADAEEQLSADRRIYINGHGEQRYWQEIELGARSGEWTSAGAGPPISVVVTPKGVEIYGTGIRMEKPLRPGQARWLACRLLEALGVYETTFAGDGSAPPGGGGRAPLVSAGGTGVTVPTGEKTWVCGCGKSSTNRGGMMVHEKTCDKGPVRPVEG